MKYIIRELKLNSCVLSTIRECKTYDEFVNQMCELDERGYIAIVYNVVESKNDDSVMIVRFVEKREYFENENV